MPEDGPAARDVSPRSSYIHWREWRRAFALSGFARALVGNFLSLAARSTDAIQLRRRAFWIRQQTRALGTHPRCHSCRYRVARPVQRAAIKGGRWRTSSGAAAMTDTEYFRALRAVAEEGDEQAAAVLRMLCTRFPKLEAGGANQGSLLESVNPFRACD